MELEPEDGRNAGAVVCSSVPSDGELKSNSILLTLEDFEVFLRWIVSVKLLPARTSAGSVEKPVTITLGTDTAPPDSEHPKI